jgi:hypothetical protein
MLRTATIGGVLLVAGLIGVLCYGGSKSSNANVQAPPADTTPKGNEAKQFGGKYLLVREKPGGENSTAIPLTDPEIKVLSGHVFLAGKIVRPNDLWKTFEGKAIWIAMDNICDLFELNDLDTMKKFFDAGISSTSSEPPAVQNDRYLSFDSPSASDPKLLDEKTREPMHPPIPSELHQSVEKERYPSFAPAVIEP